MLTRVKQAISSYIYSFFELQFIITIMSLPILIAWGMPISIMGPLANFVFTPLLIIFLWCCCCTTILALANISIPIFYQITNCLADVWIYLLSFSHPSWLIAIPSSMIKISLVFCLIIVGMYWYIKPSSKQASMVLMGLWCIIIALQPWYTTKPNTLQQVDNLKLWYIKLGNSCYLIDNGALSTRKNLYTHIDFTILPQLIKHTGHATVDTLILCKPCNQICKIAQACVQQLNCSTIMVTPQQDCYKKLQLMFQHSHIKVIPLTTKRKTAKVLKSFSDKQS